MNALDEKADTRANGKKSMTKGHIKGTLVSLHKIEVKARNLFPLLN